MPFFDPALLLLGRLTKHFSQVPASDSVLPPCNARFQHLSGTTGRRSWTPPSFAGRSARWSSWQAERSHREAARDRARQSRRPAIPTTAISRSSGPGGYLVCCCPASKRPRHHAAHIWFGARRFAMSADNARREFVRKVAYLAPAILTLAAAPAYTKAGSNKSPPLQKQPKPPYMICRGAGVYDGGIVQGTSPSEAAKVPLCESQSMAEDGRQS